MRNNVKACPGKELKQMTIEQLDTLLQSELEKEVPDEAIVLPILQELQEREKEHPVEMPEEIAGSLAGYKAHTHTENPKRKRIRVIHIAAVAAAICVVLMAIPRTAGAESVFQVLYRWTESVFEFFSSGNSGVTTVEYQFKTDNEGLQQLYDTMVAEGVTEPVVPMWLPEGYELSELKTEEISEGKKVFAKFVKGTDGLLISYQFKQSQKKTQYEKADPAINQYDVDGNSHFLFTNKGRTSATWQQNGVECVIGTTLKEDTVRKIIASIYRSE